MGEYGIKYQPRIAIKSQVLAYFIAEFTGAEQGLTSKPNNNYQLEEPEANGQQEESNLNETAQTAHPNEHGTNRASTSSTTIDEESEPAWILFVDESSNEIGSRAGIVLTNLSRLKIEQSICFGFLTSNNEA